MRILLLILFFLPVQLFAQHTDIKEFALNGKVKSITNTYYSSAKVLNGKLIPDSSTIHSYQHIYRFNEQGNIDTLETRSDDPIDTLNFIVYEFKNERKVSSKRYLSDGTVSEWYSINWITPYHYAMCGKDSMGIVFYDAETVLSRNFADSMGSVEVIIDGSVKVHSKYNVGRNEQGKTSKITYQNYLTKITNKETVDCYETDRFGNCVTIAQANAESKVIRKVTVRVIEYYE